MATKSEKEMLQQLLSQYADFQHKAFTTIENVVDRMTRSQESTVQILQTWLDSFKVTELPKSSVVHDEDILERERNYYRGRGMDVPETDLPVTAEEGITAMLKGL